MAATQYLPRKDGVRLAYRHTPGRGPAIVFLPGYASDMTGDKASALFAWAEQEGRAALLLDYSGCGASEGAFAEGTLAVWRDDALALIEALAPGPLLLVGSSMGGWLALLIARARPEQVAALVGIAAAPDFTEWSFSEERRAQLRRDGRIEDPSPYSEEPYLTTLAFWESGQANRLLEGEIAIDCPVRLLHGLDDADVPWEIAMRTAGRLRSGDVQVTLVKQGDHRLSRQQDIRLLIETVAGLLERP